MLGKEDKMNAVNDNIVDLSAFRNAQAKIVARTVASPEVQALADSWSPEARADAASNDLVAGMMQGFENMGIDVETERACSVIHLIYKQVDKLTRKHFGVE